MLFLSTVSRLEYISTFFRYDNLNELSVIHRNTDKARVQHSVEGNFYAADQG